MRGNAGRLTRATLREACARSFVTRRFVSFARSSMRTCCTFVAHGDTQWIILLFGDGRVYVPPRRTSETFARATIPRVASEISRYSRAQPSAFPRSRFLFSPLRFTPFLRAHGIRAFRQAALRQAGRSIRLAVRRLYGIFRGKTGNYESFSLMSFYTPLKD